MHEGGVVLDGAQRVLAGGDGTAARPGCSADLLPRSDRTRRGDKPARQRARAVAAGRLPKAFQPSAREALISDGWMEIFVLSAF